MSTELKIFLLAGCLLFFITTVFIVLIFINIYKRKQKGKIEKQKAQELFNKTLLKAQVEIQEQTLQTISREIHDNIGQVLSLAKINITQIKSSDTFITAKRNYSVDLISKAIQDIRDVSKSLNSESISKIGIIQALVNEIEIINKSGKNFSMECGEDKIDLDPQLQLILFRMVQECINNIIKHSNATRASIYIKHHENIMEILIEDDGVGFDEVTVSKGQGLNNLQSRAKFINAAVGVKSTVNKGTAVSIHIPC